MTDFKLPSLQTRKGPARKILLLAARSSIHTVKWANGLAERGHDVTLVSMHPGGDPLDSRVRCYQLKHKAPFGYFLNVFELKRLLKKEKPDLLHAHFISGYGTLATLTGFAPRVLSVWGTDIYNFPFSSPFNMFIARRSLASAHWICSTSWVMAKQTASVFPDAVSKMTVTPFGISSDTFKKNVSLERDGSIVIGTIKTLMEKYGIDTLIKGFAAARTRLLQDSPELGEYLFLKIYGRGPQKQELEKLIADLGLQNCAKIEDFIAHSQVPEALNGMDIYVAMSREHSESFGVAIIEASACQLPVVVSNYGGLPEVVEDGVTGVVVKNNTPEDLARTLIALVMDQKKREEMGRRGRQRVCDLYEWKNCVSLMEQVYETVLKRSL